MKILAIETSTNHFSLAIANQDRVLVEKTIILSKVLESSMIPAVDAVLKKAKLTLKQLDGFAIGLGPGSFTSLRVGVSTAKAFCLTTGKPVVGVSSLDVIAEAVKDKATQICVACDAKRNLVYACFYQRVGSQLKRDSDYLLISMDELLEKIKQDTLFVGDAIGLYKDKIQLSVNGHYKITLADEKSWYPQAKYLASLSLMRFENKKTDNPLKIIPLYLYADDCQVQKTK